MKSCYISFNLNLPLKLFFYSPILTNNNLLLKIYCENIVIAFLNCHFLFFLYYFFFLNFIHTGFFSFFSPHTCPTHISIYSSFSFSSSSSLQTLFHSLALSFLLFLFLLDSRTLSSMTSISTSIFFPLYLTSHTHSRP